MGTDQETPRTAATRAQIRAAAQALLLQHGFTRTSTAAIAGAAREEVAGGPYRDAAGTPVRGQGIGVAIIDSGVDGWHLDLSSRIKQNDRIVGSMLGLITR